MLEKNKLFGFFYSVIYLVITPIFLGFSFYFLGFFNQGHVLGTSSPVTYSQPSKIYAALPQPAGVIASSIKIEDSTPVIIYEYLKHYQSPMVGNAQDIIKSAEKYGVNPYLIVAIAQQESNLGKKSPENCFNAWGYGIHAQGTLCFSSWEEAIDKVTAGIAKNYCAKGYCDDPCVMMKKYTPLSNGSWCFGVNQFLAELENGDF